MTTYPSDIGDFIIGLSPIGGAAPTPAPVGPSVFPPTGPTAVVNQTLAYPYYQYMDDDNTSSFFIAYNAYAQAYLDYLNDLNLPVYTASNIAGPLLDWVAMGIYGFRRPALPLAGGTPARGPPNTWAPNSLALNYATPAVEPSYTTTSDDVFKRCMTWALYKGDGRVVTPNWVKRRVNRFLGGINGTDVPNDTTYGVSLYSTGYKAWTIALATTDISTIFQSAVNAGVLELPFQVEWSVSLT